MALSKEARDDTLTDKLADFEIEILRIINHKYEKDELGNYLTPHQDEYTEKLSQAYDVNEVKKGAVLVKKVIRGLELEGGITIENGKNLAELQKWCENMGINWKKFINNHKDIPIGYDAARRRIKMYEASLDPKKWEQWLAAEAAKKQKRKDKDNEKKEELNEKEKQLNEKEKELELKEQKMNEEPKHTTPSVLPNDNNNNNNKNEKNDDNDNDDEYLPSSQSGSVDMNNKKEKEKNKNDKTQLSLVKQVESLKAAMKAATIEELNKIKYDILDIKEMLDERLGLNVDDVGKGIEFMFGKNENEKKKEKSKQQQPSITEKERQVNKIIKEQTKQQGWIFGGNNNNGKQQNNKQATNKHNNKQASNKQSNKNKNMFKKGIKQ